METTASSRRRITGRFGRRRQHDRALVRGGEAPKAETGPLTRASDHVVHLQFDEPEKKKTDKKSKKQARLNPQLSKDR